MRHKPNVRPCDRCESLFSSHLAQCPRCRYWNLTDDTLSGRGGTLSPITDSTVLLADVKPNPITRLATGPWDKCWGPGKAPSGRPQDPFGIVNTSVSLLGGEPGAGKSTMSLQLVDSICHMTNREGLYIGTEEAVEEIKYRGERLNLTAFDKIRVLPMGSDDDLSKVILRWRPVAIIIDSLAGMGFDNPGEAVEVCKRFKSYAIEIKSPFIVIDHVNKDGDFAGLNALQHAVDTTMTFFNDEDDIRTLTTIKNRFGPANVSARFYMTDSGLHLLEEEDEADSGKDD